MINLSKSDSGTKDLLLVAFYGSLGEYGTCKLKDWESNGAPNGDSPLGTAPWVHNDQQIPWPVGEGLGGC